MISSNERTLTKHPFLLIFLFFGLIAIAITAPISSITHVPNLADLINHLGLIIQAKAGIAEGQFPLRVTPIEQFGWRYPVFQFYSSTTYTFAGLIYYFLTPNNPLIAFKITLWLGLVCGGFYMYRLAYWFVGVEISAVLAGVVYLFAPYMIIIINHLGSLNEVVALGILPAALYYSILRYFNSQKTSLLLQSALAWYLIATIHIITFIYGLLFLALFLLFITIKNRKRWKSLVSVGMGVAFACLLAMWYLAPIALLEKYFYIHGTYSDSEFMRQHHPLLSQLLFSSASLTTGYKSSALLTIHPAVGWPILIGVLVSFYAFVNRLSFGNKRADYFVPLLLILFAVAFLLVWSPFNVWRWLPHILFAGQHCWRLLSQVIWIGALLFAWATCWLFQKNLNATHLVIGAVLIALSADAWFPISENASFKLADFIKNPSVIYNRDSFLINYKKNDALANRIDNLLLFEKNKLSFSSSITIKKELLAQTLTPELIIRAVIPSGLNLQNYQLLALNKDRLLSVHDLHPGPLNWNISLRDKNLTNIIFKLQKKGETTYQTAPSIPIEKIFLTGFVNPNEIVNVKQMEPHCHQNKTSTVCQINISEPVKFLELPIMYYPELLKIKLNGKVISYESIVYQGYLIAGIKPVLGENKVEVQFQGLVWANRVSWLAWIVWFGLLCGYLRTNNKCRVGKA